MSVGENVKWVHKHTKQQVQLSSPSPRPGTADAEIKVPSAENPALLMFLPSLLKSPSGVLRTQK